MINDYYQMKKIVFNICNSLFGNIMIQIQILNPISEGLVFAIMMAWSEFCSHMTT